jgi:hypothetical protein
MPKYTRSNIEGLAKVDDNSGEDKWTLDASTLIPDASKFTAGPIRYNTENKAYKITDPGQPGKTEATREVSSDVTDQEGKPVSFGTREHELREATRVSKAPATSKGWDSSTYDPEVDGYASEYGYDPEADIAWENKRAKKAGQQTQYGWKAMLKESRGGNKGIFGTWLANKVLSPPQGSKSGAITRVPFYWTGDTAENGEDLIPSGTFSDTDFRESARQLDTRQKGDAQNVKLGPERYFKQAGAAEEQTLNLLTVTGDPNKKRQKLKTVNIPERAEYESQQAGTQTDNDAADRAVAQVFAPTPKAQKTTRATPTPTAQPAPAVDPQTGTTNTPMKIVCPKCSAVSGDDPVAFKQEHKRLHAQ